MNRVDSSAATVAMVAQPAMARWRLVLSVFKLRIGTLIMLTAIAGLAVVPGGAFGEDNCLRLSYALSMDDLREGFDRVAKALKSLA